MLWKTCYQGECTERLQPDNLSPRLFPIRMTSQHMGPTCVWVDRQIRSTVQNVIIHRALYVLPHSLCIISEQPSTQRRARVAELADARDLGSRG